MTAKTAFLVFLHLFVYISLFGIVAYEGDRVLVIQGAFVYFLLLFLVFIVVELDRVVELMEEAKEKEESG